MLEDGRSRLSKYGGSEYPPIDDHRIAQLAEACTTFQAFSFSEMESWTRLHGVNLSHFETVLMKDGVNSYLYYRQHSKKDPAPFKDFLTLEIIMRKAKAENQKFIDSFK